MSLADEILRSYLLEDSLGDDDQNTDNQNDDQDQGEDNNNEDQGNDNTQDDQGDDNQDEYEMNDPETDDTENQEDDQDNEEDNQDDQDNDNQDEYEMNDPETDDTENQEDDQGGEGGDEYEMNDPETDNSEDQDDTDSEMGDQDDPSQKLKDIEKSIFDQLSPEQQKTKTMELKNLYNETYEKCQSIIDTISNIEKVPDQAKVYDYIVRNLTDLQRYIRDYLENLFDSKTYIENMTELQKYLAILDTINNVFKEMQKKAEYDEKQ